VKAYITYVRPLLEYAACVRSPYQLDDIAKIESVQRRFTKRLPGLSNTSYSDRLAVLGLRRLQLRRLHQDLIYTYKIILGWWIWIALSFSLSVQMKQHVNMLINCLFVAVVWMFESIFFGNRVVKIWNSLPATVEDFASLRKFKSFIQRVDLSQYVNL